MTGHVNGGGEMISGSGRHGDKSVGALSGGGAQARAYETGRRSASYRARLLCLVASRDSWNRSNSYEFRHGGTRGSEPRPCDLRPGDLRSRITIARRTIAFDGSLNAAVAD